MATAVALGQSEYPLQGVVRTRWVFNASGHGTDLTAPNMPYMTVHVAGVPSGAGNTSNIVIEGSNEGPTGAYYPLTSPTGGALSFGQGQAMGPNGIVRIEEPANYIRPRCATATSGVGNMTVVIVAGR